MAREVCYEILKDTRLFCGRSSKLWNFVNDASIVDNINLIDIPKLKYLIDRWYSTVRNTDYNIRNMKKIFQSPRSAFVINSIDMEKLQILNFDNKFGISRFMWLMDNQNVLNALHFIEVERLRLLISYDLSIGKIIMENLLLGNTINAINSLDIEKFNLFKIGKFNGLCLLKMFQNKIIIESINTIDIERLRYLFQNGKMCVEFLGKRDFPQSVGIELLINYDKYYYFDKMDDLTDIDKIEIEKLRIIAECDIFDRESILKLISTSDIIDLINSIDVNKFEILLFHDRKVNKLGMERRRFFHNCLHGDVRIVYGGKNAHEQIVLTSLLNPEFVAAVNLMDAEKISYLLQSPAEYKNLAYSMFVTTLSQPIVCELVNCVKIDKLEVLFEICNIFEFFQLASDEKTSKFIKLINVQKLKTIFKMMSKVDFVPIARCCNGDMMQNLNFTIAMYDAGVFENVNLDFIYNKKVIEDEIKKIFPENSPIDQILQPSAIKNEGVVPNLKYLCLEAAIGLVEQSD